MELIPGKLYTIKSHKETTFLFEKTGLEDNPFAETDIYLKTSDILFYTGTIKLTCLYEFLFKNKYYYLAWIDGLKEV